MLNLWLSHDREDDLGGAVSFVAAELERAGANVRFLPQAFQDAERLWVELKPLIANRSRTDAWLAYLSEATLSDGRAVDGLVHVLAGAAAERGPEFAALGVVPGSLPVEVPHGLRFGAVVKLTDQQWASRAVALAQGKKALAETQGGRPFALALHHRGKAPEQSYALEMRPLSGLWCPFFAAVPAQERDAVQPELRHGARGIWPEPEPGLIWSQASSADRAWWSTIAGREAGRAASYFLCCARLPTLLRFGVPEAHLQYTLRLMPVR